MNQRFIRTEMLLGSTAMEKLRQSKVAIFGLGGVGSFAAEALARSGIGHFLLVDHDTVSISNLNRQLVAYETTIGKYKADVMKERIHLINPEAEVEVLKEFFLPGMEPMIDDRCRYVIDAIDTVTGKIALVLEAQRRGIPIISSMGTGNKLNPSQLEIADIYSTSVCPLAKVMRKELRARGVKKLKVLYSKEYPIQPQITKEVLESLGEHTEKRMTPGSVAFVPPVAGLMIAGEVVLELGEVK